MQALAEEVECSVGAIYRYFRSKDEVIDAVHADRLSRLLVRLTEREVALDSEFSSAGTSEQVAALGRVIGRLRMVHKASLADAPMLSVAHRSLLAPEPSDDDPRAASARAAVKLVRYIGAAIDTAVERGALHPFSVDGLAVATFECMTAVSLAAAAGRLETMEAEWIGRASTLGALTVSGARRSDLEAAAPLAWRVPHQGP